MEKAEWTPHNRIRSYISERTYMDEMLIKYRLEAFKEARGWAQAVRLKEEGQESTLLSLADIVFDYITKDTKKDD